MSRNTGDLRNVLMDCIEKVRKGELSAADGKAVAMLAGQVNLSLQVELNAKRMGAGLDAIPFGALPLEGGLPVIENATAPTPDPLAIARAPWPGGVTRHTLEG